MTLFQFYDDKAVHGSMGLTRRLVPLHLYPRNPMLVPDRPWEGNVAGSYPTVLYDSKERLFKCWYEGRPARPGMLSNICYAVSPDGVQWEKPDLGIVTFERSRRNNIVLRSRRKSSPLVGANVVYRPRADPPYRLVYWDEIPGLGQGYCTADSEDGIRWTPHSDNPVFQTPLDRTRNSNDDVLSASWDPRRRRYVAWSRTIVTENLIRPQKQRSVPCDFFERVVCQIRSRDGVRWSPLRVVLGPNLSDPPDTQLYGMSGMVQPDGSMVGFLFVSHWNRGTIDIELAYSPDGESWSRVMPGHPILENGRRGSWNCGIIHVAASPFIVENNLHVYHSGLSRLHAPHNKGIEGRFSMGLATAKGGRLVGICAGKEGGRCILRQIEWTGQSIVLNANARRGEIRVGLRDDCFEFYKGYDSASSIPLRGDAVDHTVQWKHGRDLACLKGKPVYIQVEMESAELYEVKVV